MKTYRIICKIQSSWKNTTDILAENLSLEEAKERIWEFAMEWEGRGDCEYENEASIASWTKYLKETEGVDYDSSWFVGEGVYANHEPIMLKGETSYSIDCERCYIEEE